MTDSDSATALYLDNEYVTLKASSFGFYLVCLHACVYMYIHVYTGPLTVGLVLGHDSSASFHFSCISRVESGTVKLDNVAYKQTKYLRLHWRGAQDTLKKKV